MEVVHWFQLGGAAMYGVLAALMGVGSAMVLVLVLAVAAWFVPELRWPARIGGVLMLLGCTAPLLVGVAGWQYGLRTVEAALANVDPAFAEQIRVQGAHEARIPMVFGGASSMVLVVPALLATGVAFAARNRDP